MASLFRHSSKLLPLHSLCSSIILKNIPGIIPPPFESPAKTRSYAANESKHLSPFDLNVVRIIETEIDYQYEYGPPDQLSPSFNSFSIEEHPSEQFVRLSRRFGKNEDIKVEATMFDGCISEPKAGDDNDGEDLRLHISLLVDIYKSEGSDGLGFVRSA